MNGLRSSACLSTVSEQLLAQHRVQRMQSAATMLTVGQRKRRAAAVAAHPSVASTTKMTSIRFNWSRQLFLISFMVAIISAACSIKTGK